MKILFHIIKIVRAEIRSNLWILAELFVVFIVLWVMVDIFTRQFQVYHQPVGYDTEHVYQAIISHRSKEAPSYVKYDDDGTSVARDYQQIVAQIRQHPDVEVVSISSYSEPYTFSCMNSGMQRDTTSQSVTARQHLVTPAYFRLFDIHTAEGDAPETLAEKLPQEGMIISQNLAEKLFKATNAVGQYVLMGNDSVRISAVCETLRNDEYNENLIYAYFNPLSLQKYAKEDATEEDYADLALLFRIRPAADSRDYAHHFLQEMRTRLQVGNLWLSDVKSYEAIRYNFLANSEEASSQKLLSAVGAFLLVNVFLALIGTFWFRVNRRREEIGLRMAVGASRRSILGFTFLEGLMLLTLAALPALVVCFNLVVLDLVPTATTDARLFRFGWVSLATWCLLACTILLAIWYPARKATHIAPAEALHYE